MGIGPVLDNPVVEQRSLIDRIVTAERGMNRNNLFSILRKLPYDLFNGDFKMYAGFIKDPVEEFVLLTPNESGDKIEDINLPCEEHYDEIGRFYVIPRGDFDDIKIYTKRPPLDYLINSYLNRENARI